MRVIVAGTRSFGAAVVGELDSLCDVVAVVNPSPTDKTWHAARDLDLPVELSLTEGVVRAYGADLIVSAHSHQFIGQKSRHAATLGAIGYHPSLLPRHRGRDAVRWTVAFGDPIAGGSVYWLSDNVDAGDLAAQDWCWVKPGWSHHDLWRKELFPMGVALLAQTVEDLIRGQVTMVPQDESVATWEPSWEREPLHRPELLELGPMPPGYRVERGKLNGGGRHASEAGYGLARP